MSKEDIIKLSIVWTFMCLTWGILAGFCVGSILMTNSIQTDKKTYMEYFIKITAMDMYLNNELTTSQVNKKQKKEGIGAKG